jgi:hypothetical protein
MIVCAGEAGNDPAERERGEVMRNRWRVAAAAVALGVGLWMGAAQSQSIGGGDGAGSGGAAPRWEHRVVFADFGVFGETDLYKRIEREAKDELTAVYRYHELMLDKLGREGWELVHVQAKLPSKTVFYLKRLGRER